MAASHPPTLLSVAARTVREEQLFARGERVLVAVSGGPDSIALLHVLALLRERIGHTLVAQGVDHGLRAEASQELDLAADLARTLDVPFARTRVELAHGGNLQERARVLRYEALRAGRKIATISRAEPRKHPIPLPFAGEPDVWEEKPERLRFAEVLPLFLRLNDYGTNTLLYLTRCSHNRRSGTVELVAPGVMRGYVDDFVILPEMEMKDHAAWLRIAVNAWLLDQGPNASFRTTEAA